MASPLACLRAIFEIRDDNLHTDTDYLSEYFTIIYQVNARSV